MKMAKASEADISMAIDLANALDALTNRWAPIMPEAIQQLGEGEDTETFDEDDDEDCGRALRHILYLVNQGGLFRVVMGMAVLLDPANKLIDPDADTLEHHPDAVAARAALAAARGPKE